MIVNKKIKAEEIKFAQFRDEAVILHDNKLRKVIDIRNGKIGIIINRKVQYVEPSGQSIFVNGEHVLRIL